MNWISTNIRFRENEYMELKMEVALRRISLAALIRERISESIHDEKQRSKRRKR